MALNEKHLISADEFLQLARPASKHLDEDEIKAYVREVEDKDIIPIIGVELYNTFINAVTDSALTEEEKILFKGGAYVPTGSCDCAPYKICAGLKRAVAYLAYAKFIAANGGIVTRSGYMQHDDTYATRMDDKNRANQRRDVQNMAEYYLGQCVEYYNQISGNCCAANAPRGGLVRVKSIGRTIYN